MIRKFAIAAAAVAVLGAVSLAGSATPAAAMGWKGHHHHHHGHFWHGFRFYGPLYGYGGWCLRKVLVVNRYGQEVLRTVNVCY
jgi:hypothetical protein